MHVLIVHAHPEAHSFTAAMRDTAVDFFRSGGHTVTVSDLYAMGWNPVASAADFGTRSNPEYMNYALEQRINTEASTLAPDIAAELDKLMAADLVIFSFPLYWFSVPAMLKGWIDRVLVSGKVYGGRRFYDNGGLRGKRALVALTCGAREHMLTGADSIHGDLTQVLRPLLQGTLAYTGMTVLPPFTGFHIPYLSVEQRTAILTQYRAYLGTLESLEPLKMPVLADYDREMRRLPPPA